MSKMKDCCCFQEGYVNPPQSRLDYFGGSIKWLRSLDLNNSFVYSTSRTLTKKGFESAGKSAYMFPKDSIAISKSGTIGELGILKDTMCGNRAVINIEVNSKKADLMYIFYFLKYKKEEILKRAVGSIQKNLYISELSEIELCHNDIYRQKQISGVLSAIDSKIENNNKINSELESMAKTIYDYWFLQFEFPNEEGKPYKSSGGKMVWNEELGREIPEGWEVKKLADTCKCILGGTPSREKKDYWGGNINWINSGMINNFRISTYSEKITKLGLENSSTYLMPKNTVVLAITGATLGQVSILNIEACANQSVVGILENSQMPTEYIYPLILSTIKNLLNNKTGAAQPHINKNDIMSFKIIIPNERIMKNYMSNVKGIYELIMKNEKENQELASVRDFLLPLLMNGQVGFKENINIKDIEVGKEEVLT